MTKKPKSRLPFDARRKVILVEALKLFASHGFHGVSVESIAVASDITKPVLYDHFPSKEKLYLAVICNIREKLMAASARFFSSDGDLRMRIRTGIEEFFIFSETNPGAIRVLLTSPDDIKELKKELNRIQDEVTENLVTLFARIVVRGRGGSNISPRLKLKIEFIKQGIHGLAKWWPDHPHISRTELVEAVTDVVWKWIDAL